MERSLVNFLISLISGILVALVVFLFWEQTLVSLVLIILIGIVSLILMKDKFYFHFYLLAGLIASIVEIIFVFSGAYVHHSANFAGIPIRLFFSWGQLSLIIGTFTDVVNDGKKIKNKSRNFLIAVIGSISTVLVFSFFWREKILPAALILLIGILSLFLIKRKEYVFLYVVTAIIASLLEATASSFGIFTHNNANLLGIPMRITFAWGIVSIFAAALYEFMKK